MRTVEVALGERSYHIYIGGGLMDELAAFVRAADFSSRGLLVTDAQVGALYGAQVAETLTRAGIAAEIVTIPAGEPSKSLDMANLIYTRAIELGLDRRSPIFALGGGVVGDLAGFIAATYMRGVPFVQIPTSLLAQVDSSVGGKVAVNHPLGKNLIGAFYQPAAVFIDLDFLHALPPREIASGLGEIIKYGIISDADFFTWLAEHTGDVRALRREAAIHMIARSCEIKADVVAHDEYEGGLRRILNFGHTIAHAVETETGYMVKRSPSAWSVRRISVRRWDCSRRRSAHASKPFFAVSGCRCVRRASHLMRCTPISFTIKRPSGGVSTGCLRRASGARRYAPMCRRRRCGVRWQK